MTYRIVAVRIPQVEGGGTDRRHGFDGCAYGSEGIEIGSEGQEGLRMSGEYR